MDREEENMLFDEYINSDDFFIDLGAEKYYRAFRMDKFRLKGEKWISIILPMCMFENSSSITIKNDCGEVFKLHGPAFIRFIGDTPKWYIKCMEFFIKESDYDHPLDDIGSYFCICPDDACESIPGGFE